MSTEILLNVAWVLLMSLLGLALPVGIGRLAARPAGEKGAGARGRLLLAGMLALLVSFVCGFSLQYGGIHVPSLGESLQPGVELAPMGGGSGLVGWAGPFVPTETGRLALFLLQAVGAATVVVLALTPVCQRMTGPGLVAVALFAAGVLYPLLGNWTWGGGWLAATGWRAYLGHGFVDWGGAGVLYALGGLLALAGLLASGARRSDAVEEDSPATGMALLATVGIMALNLAAGWAFHQQLPLVAVNTLVSAAGAGVVATIYMAFTTARFHFPMLARGLLAGAVASTGIAPFAPPLSLLLVGAVAGLLACFGSFLIERVWRLDDRSGIVSVFGLAGLWGVLAVGLFAEGTFGQLLNGVGQDPYLGVAGQGVSGIVLLAPGMVRDFGQLTAQVLGLLVIAVLALGPGWLVFRLGSASVASRE